MALGIRTYFEVRTPANGGLSTNGGGANPANVNFGMDLTQQAPIIRTDLVIGSGSTLTSAGTPFSASEVGNLIHISSGTGFTVGFYELVSISGVTVTLDRSPGTLASTGGTGRVGGPLSSINDTPTLSGGKVWVQAGLGYSLTTQWFPSAGSGDGNFVDYEGYGTVRGDGLRATLTYAGAASPIVGQAGQMIWRNFVLDGTNGATRGMDLGANNYVENCQYTRFTLSGVRAQNAGSRVRRSLFTFCGASAGGTGTGLDVGSGSVASECEAHDCQNGFTTSNAVGVFLHCLARGNTQSGFYQTGDFGMVLVNCNSDGNVLAGLQMNDSNALQAPLLINNLFTNNPYGIRSVTIDYSGAQFAPAAAFYQNNAFFNNTTANYSQVPAGASDILLTADPYTNRAGLDFSLNGNNPGGAQLLGAGLPGGFGLEGAGAAVSVSHVDIGAVQGLAAAPASSATQIMRSLWREATNERFTPADATSPVPDLRVDIYLDYGLEALNREAHYHWTDGVIAMVAGQQQYNLPADFVVAQFLQFSNFRRLERGSVERWMSDNDDWRNESGEPRFWAIYSNQLIVRPTPTAEAVAAAPNLILRYCSTPPSITTNGPEQLGSQEYRLVVSYGALRYAIDYPESLVAQQKIAELQKVWADAVPKVVQDYAARQISS